MKRMTLFLMMLAVIGWTAAAKAEVYVYRDYRVYRDVASQSAVSMSIRSKADQMADATSDLSSLAAAEARSSREESVYIDTFGNRVVSTSNRITLEESQALHSLRDLNIAAQQLDQAVERRWWSPDTETRTEYRVLVAAHTRASADIGGLRPTSDVYDQFRRVDRLMDELSDLYA